MDESLSPASTLHHPIPLDRIVSVPPSSVIFGYNSSEGESTSSSLSDSSGLNLSKLIRSAFLNLE